MLLWQVLMLARGLMTMMTIITMMKVYLVFSDSVCSENVFAKVFLASQDALEVMGVTHSLSHSALALT